MKEFFDGLITKIQQAVVKDFQDIQKQVGSEKIYAAALVTDSSCVTLGLWVNTVEQVEPKDNEYGFYDKEAYIEQCKDYLTPERIEEIRSSDGPAESVKWMPDEWQYSSYKAGGTVDICKLLSDKASSSYNESAEAYDEFCKLFIETVTTAFRNLIQVNTFGLDPNEVTYFLYMTDDDRVNNIAKESSKLLNTARVHEEFLKHSGF